MSIKPKLNFLLILTIFLSLTIQNQNILNLNTQTFSSAKSQYQYLLIYFYDISCQQCKITTTIFHTFYALSVQQNMQQLKKSKNQKDIHKQIQIFKLDRGKVQFAQIVLQGNQEIFKKQKIQAVPQIRIYVNKNMKDKNKEKLKDSNLIQMYSYNYIQYNYQNLQKLATWTKIITEQYFPNIQNIQQLQKQKKYVIIDCKQQQLMNKLKQIYLQNLQLNFICTQNSKQNLKHSKILLKQQKYTKILQKCLTKQNQQHKLQQICINKIINFKYKGILHWSQQYINNLYNKNYAIVLLISSNQSVSHQYLKNLTKIKNKLDTDQKQLSQKLPIFTVADIHYNLQQAMRIKKFVGGYDIKGWPYPYPILAYLQLNKQQDKIIKYVYQIRQKQAKRQQLTIQQWLPKARKHQLQKYYRGMNLTTEMDLVDNAGKNIYKIYLSQLLQLRQRRKKQQSPTPKKPSMYLYVYWKINWEMQILGDQLRNWWTQANKYSGVVYHFDLYDNQLPGDVQVNSLPAIVVFYLDDTFQVHQHIKNIGEIQQIFKNANKKYRTVSNKEKDN